MRPKYNRRPTSKPESVSEDRVDVVRWVLTQIVVFGCRAIDVAADSRVKECSRYPARWVGCLVRGEVHSRARAAVLAELRDSGHGRAVDAFLGRC